MSLQFNKYLMSILSTRKCWASFDRSLTQVFSDISSIKSFVENHHCFNIYLIDPPDCDDSF